MILPEHLDGPLLLAEQASKLGLLEVHDATGDFIQLASCRGQLPVANAIHSGANGGKGRRLRWLLQRRRRIHTYGGQQDVIGAYAERLRTLLGLLLSRAVVDERLRLLQLTATGHYGHLLTVCSFSTTAAALGGGAATVAAAVCVGGRQRFARVF